LGMGYIKDFWWYNWDLSTKNRDNGGRGCQKLWHHSWMTLYLLHEVDHLADGGDVVVVDGPVGDAAVEVGVVVRSFAAQVVNLRLISSTFYERFLRMQIPKGLRRLTIGLYFCAFGICARKSCLLNIDEIDTWNQNKVKKAITFWEKKLNLLTFKLSQKLWPLKMQQDIYKLM